MDAVSFLAAQKIISLCSGILGVSRKPFPGPKGAAAASPSFFPVLQLPPPDPAVQGSAFPGGIEAFLGGIWAFPGEWVFIVCLMQCPAWLLLPEIPALCLEQRPHSHLAQRLLWGDSQLESAPNVAFRT